MHKALFAAVTLLSSTSLLAQAPVTLAQMRDRFRPLLVFAASPSDASLLAQMTYLKDHAPGLQERDVVVIAVPFRDPAPTEASLSAADAADARRVFHIAPDEFTVVLLGKDGGEKFRSKKPVFFSKLQTTIDAMPMRQREIKDTSHP